MTGWVGKMEGFAGNVFNRSCVEISLDALATNYKKIREITNKNSEIMAVVKANAYGHDAIACARTLHELGVRNFCVATVDEAIELRLNGINDKILILGFTDISRIEDVVKYDLHQAVYDVGFARELSLEAVKQGKKVSVHVKIDTGMRRIGFGFEETSVGEIVEVCRLSGIEPYGIFSHFASSDTNDDDFTILQYERFITQVERLKDAGVTFSKRHICNSAGIIRFPKMHLDMVRAGIILYGYLPQGCPDYEKMRSKLKLKPVLKWFTKIVQIKTINEGETVGYGRRFVAKSKTKVATCTVGYADGFSRALSNGFELMIGDVRVKVIGNVCMDMMLLDISDVKESVKVGDVVNLIGDFTDATYMADYLGTINYEVLCGISERVRKIFIKNDRMIYKLEKYNII